MKENMELVLFENKKIRRQLYNGEWYYSIVDIMEVLSESSDPRDYWYRLKKRLEDEEGFEPSTNCRQLKMVAKDGKRRGTDCANRETIFRLIQSVPSKRAEPFKLWFAKLAEERIKETINPEIAIERARNTYLSKGYSKEWTDTRIKGILVRNELTYEWKNRGAFNPRDFAILTNDISKGTFGITTLEHRNIKKLKENQHLRDNMSSLELVLTTLAEVTTTELHKTNDSQGMESLRNDAKTGGEIAAITRKNIEDKLGKKVVTSETAKDFISKNQFISSENDILNEKN